MRHQVQKGVCGILVGIQQHQKGYLVYVTHRRKIISSCDVVFDEIFPEAMAMLPDVSYIPYATFSKGEMAI